MCAGRVDGSRVIANVEKIWGSLGVGDSFGSKRAWRLAAHSLGSLWLLLVFVLSAFVFFRALGWLDADCFADCFPCLFGFRRVVSHVHRFSAMTMKAVGTAAMEMVQEVEIQFDEVWERDGKAESGVVSLHTDFSALGWSPPGARKRWAKAVAS